MKMGRAETCAIVLIAAGLIVSNDLVALAMFVVAAAIFAVLAYGWINGILERTAGNS